MHDTAVLIFTKTPRAGLVKTRLIPAIGEEAATRLYIDLLNREVQWIADELPCAIELWATPDCRHPVLQGLALRHGLSCHRQQGDDLGQRMEHAAQQALQRYDKVILLGVDCPALTAQHLRQAIQWLAEGADAVLGPAQDGGYVLLALKRSDRSLFHGHRWGGEEVAASTRSALRSLCWDWRELPPLWDLDRPEDLARLSALNIGVAVDRP